MLSVSKREQDMRLKIDTLLSFSFVVFFCYALQLRWIGLDNQSFSRLGGVSGGYGGEIIPRHIGTLFLFFIIFILLLSAKVTLRTSFLFSPLFYLASIIPVLSIFWTINVSRTVNGIVLLFVTAIFCAIFVQSLGVRKTLKLFFTCSMILVTGTSILAIFGDPHVLMHTTHAGLWRGLFNHKNVYGPFLATLFVLIVFGRSLLGISRLTVLLCTGLVLFSLFKTGSSTSVAVLTVGLFTQFLNMLPIKSISLRVILYFIGIFLLFFGVIILLSNLQGFTELFGRDVTLTGRTQLWAAALPYTLEHTFGFGFATSGGDQVIDAIVRRSGWEIANSTHNVYITRAIDVGVMGMVLMVAWVTQYIFIAKPHVVDPLRAILSSICVMYLMGGLTEVAGIFYTNSTTVVILIMIAGIRQKDRSPASAGNKAYPVALNATYFGKNMK